MVQFYVFAEWKYLQLEWVLKCKRAVMLQKVYRNTKSILRYIQSLGYVVDIPEGMREGVPVQEYFAASVEEEIALVKTLREKNPKSSLGILSKDDAYLAPFHKAMGNEEGVHVFTMEESQGVEFDIVCIVGMHDTEWSIENLEMPQDFIDEKQKILHDLQYVALTRAISELHVMKIG